MGSVARRRAARDQKFRSPHVLGETRDSLVGARTHDEPTRGIGHSEKRLNVSGEGELDECEP